jgi:uncharacterized protein (TIGR02466 family)
MWPGSPISQYRLAGSKIHYPLAWIRRSNVAKLCPNPIRSPMLTKNDNWIENSDILSIFPTFVWTLQSTPKFYEKVNTEILKALNEMNPDLADIPPGDAWQSHQQLHKCEAFLDLAPRILTTAKTVLQFLRINYDAIEITACWANINSTGASHAIHNHPNNFLSGVYYVQTQAGADTVNFHDPRPQTSIIRPPVTDLTGQNTDQVVVNVSDGSLLMFPAYLSHSVSRNESDQMRISISFNLMFSLFTENLSEPLWGS